MTTAVDTNVLVALLGGTGTLAPVARESLNRATRQGPLVIAPAVYAELLAAPTGDVALIDQFLIETSIAVDWRLDEPIWRAAGLAYREYAARRRRQPGDLGPRRILADFVIGAHAVHRAATLLTFDDRIYRAAFPALAVRNPDDE